MSRETTFLVSRDARCLNLIRSLAQVGWKYISKVTWSFTTFISPVLSLTTCFVTTGIMHLLYYSFVVFLDSPFLLRHATFSFSQSHGSTHNSPHRIVSQQHSCLHRTTFAALLLFTRFFSQAKYPNSVFRSPATPLHHLRTHPLLLPLPLTSQFSLLSQNPKSTRSCPTVINK